LRAMVGLEGARLVIFGEGPDEAALREQIAAMHLGQVVTLAGPRASVADEIAAADVFVVSSRWESGPLVLLEAMMLGRPVVSTAVGLAPQIVRDGDTGRLLPVGDAAALGAAIAEVLADPAHAAAMGDRGRRAVESAYSSDAIVTRIEHVYRQVLHR
ncbi:MAG: hypothetical protein QOI47_2023, partial [Actinomycetota bacterium]|nr:hypothetical protein [Actinomycetota bacterium]